MANCHDLFKQYNQRIRLDDSRRSLLISTRDRLRKRMQYGYSLLRDENNLQHRLEFYSQGSVVMDTIINPEKADYDLDDGVYFLGNLEREDRPITEDFHNWVVKAVGAEEDYGEVTDKDTCVRVKYKEGMFTDSNQGFHIDLPIYYAVNSDNPDLAHKKESWILSHPIDFIVWFEEKVQSRFQKGFILESALYDDYQNWLTDVRKIDAQLRRIVRYLKGWADTQKNEMPAGIVMTILAAQNYAENERDDIALKDTLVRIRSYLEDNHYKCPRPTTPVGEDILASYDNNKKSFFKKSLDSFINSAKSAVAHPNQKDACAKWQAHLGNRFPCELAKDEIENSKSYMSPAIIGDSAKSA